MDITDFDEAKNLIKQKGQFIKIEEILDKYGIDHLYYIAPVSNIPSILARGILSFNRVQKIEHQDFSMRYVQKRREEEIPGTGKEIHDYVPLYFATHTPMQRVLIFGTKNKPRSISCIELAFIVLNGSSIFQQPGVIFTDGNAASEKTGFYTNLADLEKLDWDIIRRRSGTTRDYKRKKAAEVLVPNFIPVTYFNKIVVFNEDVKKILCDVTDSKHLSKHQFVSDMRYYL